MSCLARIYPVKPAFRGININKRYASAQPEVKIYEVGVRDGLQNEKKVLPTNVKLELIDKLSAAGISHIEAASFVHPKWVPQMGDAVQVMQGLQRRPAVNYPVLVPNLKGYQVAAECGAEEVAIFPASSDGFSQKNLNCSVEESLKMFGAVAAAARRDGLRVRGYISTVVGCPYDGPVSPKAVAKVAEALLDMGCYELSLGDTIGVGTAGSVRRLIAEVVKVTPAHTLAAHFHDTYGQGLANTLVSLDMGVKTVDASIAGLGGCPYASGATGNLSTEDLVYMLYGLGCSTNIDLVKLCEAGRYVCRELGKATTESRVNRALGDKLRHPQDIVRMAGCLV